MYFFDTHVFTILQAYGINRILLHVCGIDFANNSGRQSLFKGELIDKNPTKSIGNNCSAGMQKRIGENILSAPGLPN